MNNKTTTYLLIVVTLASLLFGAYSYNRASTIESEVEQWKAKYEEALVDVEEATTREQKAKEELEKALKDSEEHRMKAEEALAQLEKNKARK